MADNTPMVFEYEGGDPTKPVVRPMNAAELADRDRLMAAPRPSSLATDPLVPASVAVGTAVAAAMATVAITSPTLTQAQKDSIHSQVTAQVQAVIDEHLNAAPTP
jgi:hypothetical protein